MRSSLLTTLVIVLLALLGLAYVMFSGPPVVAAFDYSRYQGDGAPDAPVQVAIIGDLRCPSCRKAHMGPLTARLERYREEGAVAVFHVPYPVTHADSMQLAVKAWSYARFHQRSPADVDALLFEADSTHLSLDEAEALLSTRLGPIPEAARTQLDAESEQTLRASNRYLASVGIASTPTVIVNGVMLRAPKPEVAAAQIEAALADARRKAG